MYNFKLFNMHTLETVKQYNFKTKKEANKALKMLMKSNDMQKHAGHIVNYTTGKEIIKQY